jgi:transcriptional regulator with XRE-family HTH domain
MRRENLLKSKEYWLAQIQNDLFGVMESYMKDKKLNRTKLAQKLGVTKGYITQLFNGDFDHKISKLVELSLMSGKVPILSFVDIDRFISEDKNDKVFELIPMKRPKIITYTLMENRKYDNKIQDIPTSILIDNGQIFSASL